MADKKKGAIFRMEEVDGKLYRVMYFKNSKGGLTRSKFIREVKRKEKKPGRPTKSTRATKNRKLIEENRTQIIKNSRRLNTPKQVPQSTRQVPQNTVPNRTIHSHKSNYKKGHPHMHKVVTPTSKFKKPGGNKYVKRSSNTQNLIDKWKNLAKK